MTLCFNNNTTHTHTETDWPAPEPRRCILVGWWSSLWWTLRWERWDRKGTRTSTGRNRLDAVGIPACPPGLAWSWERNSSSKVKTDFKNRLFSAHTHAGKFTFWCRKSKPQTRFLGSPLQWEGDQRNNHRTWWQSSSLNAEQTTGRTGRPRCSNQLKKKKQRKHLKSPIVWAHVWDRGRNGFKTTEPLICFLQQQYKA